MAFGLGKYAEVTHLSYFLTSYANNDSDFSTLELLILNDDNWSKIHEVGRDNASCEMVKSLAFDNTVVPKEGNEIEQLVNRLIDFKPQVWFFVIADCAKPKETYE
jgi:hypothetical protein